MSGWCLSAVSTDLLGFLTVPAAPTLLSDTGKSHGTAATSPWPVTSYQNV